MFKNEIERVIDIKNEIAADTVMFLERDTDVFGKFIIQYGDKRVKITIDNPDTNTAVQDFLHALESALKEYTED